MRWDINTRSPCYPRYKPYYYPKSQDCHIDVLHSTMSKRANTAFLNFPIFAASPITLDTSASVASESKVDETDSLLDAEHSIVSVNEERNVLSPIVALCGGGGASKTGVPNRIVCC